MRVKPLYCENCIHSSCEGCRSRHPCFQGTARATQSIPIPLTPENVKPGIEFAKTPVEVMPLSSRWRMTQRQADARWILGHGDNPNTNGEYFWYRLTRAEYEQLKKIAEGK